MIRNLSLVILSLALGLSGCSGGGATCGTGTTLENNACVPSVLSKCGKGTALAGKECKPVCGAGTVAGEAGCVLAEGVCGAGTLLEGTQCKLVDAMKQVTLPEATEPNAAADKAAKLALPKLGEAPVVLGGVVGPPVDEAPDFDSYRFTATALTRIRIEALAVEAPSVGVIVEPVEKNAALARYVVRADARGASRDITLPVGGDWLVKVTEATNLFPGSPARGAVGFSYIVKVSQVPSPQAKSLSTDTAVTGAWVAGDVYTITGAASTQVFEVTFDAEPVFPGLRAVWGVDGNGRLGVAAADSLTSGGNIDRAENIRIAVPPEGLTLGVDYVATLGPADGIAYRMSLKPVEVVEIDSAPYTHSGDVTNGAVLYRMHLDANTMAQAEITDDGYDMSPRITIFDPAFQPIASGSGYSPIGAYSAQGGDYFILVEDAYPDIDDEDLGYTIEVTGRTVTALGPLGAPGEATDSADGSTDADAWFAVTLDAGPAMLNLQFTPTGSASLNAQIYTLNFATLGPRTPANVGTSVVFEGIFLKTATVLLVKVQSNASGGIAAQASTTVPDFVAEVEPNNTVDTAQEITPELDATLLLAANLAEDDVDYYSFVVPTGVNPKFVFETAALSTDRPDTEIQLLDQSGTEVDSDDDGGEGVFSLLTVDSLAGGVYYLKVFHAVSYSKPGDYLLKVKAVP